MPVKSTFGVVSKSENRSYRIMAGYYRFGFYLKLVDKLLECVDLRCVFSHTLLLRLGQSLRSHELAVELSSRPLLGKGSTS